MAVQHKFYTADDLWERLRREDDNDNQDNQRYELDEGELIEMSPTGDTHGPTVNWIAFLITGHVVAHDLGEVTAAETGFVLHTDLTTGRDTVRAPDVGFIVKAKLTPTTGKFYRFAPDLAVEVVSPTDSAAGIRRKVGQYLRAGTRLIWVVYPDDRLVDVYRPGQPVETLEDGAVLDGGDILPGFKATINDVFARLRD
jgi:Uma2 family endonuclease